MFARFDLPEVVVTDNGTCFTSSEFQEFAQRNIRHLRTAPYHPSSNGLAERAVQTFKLGMKKQLTGSLQTKLSQFLFNYRLTPNTTTCVAPAELLLFRRPRSHLDAMVPQGLKVRVQQQQQKQKCQHDQHAKLRVFKQGDSVLILDFCRGSSSSWSPGTVMETSHGQSYEIKLSSGQIVKRHVDHIHACESSEDVVFDEELEDVAPIPIVQQRTPDEIAAQPPLRRSQRIKRPPVQFQTY